jgi:predicted Zn-ribbon and HTH transcriptional regulator
MKKEKEGEKLYECQECGMKYRDKELAEKCRAWCAKHKSCNLDIIKFAVEEEGL